MELDIIKHSEWKDTKFTLHLISQILGKIKLETAQQEPQWAHVTLAVTPEGFSTGLLFHSDTPFQLDLDIINSRIQINVDGDSQSVPLQPSKSIKAYFDEIFQALNSRGIMLSINPKPQEMAYTNRLNEDDAPLTFKQADAVRGLKLFHYALREQLKFVGPLRCRKVKPALFWGTFDVSLLVLHGIPEAFPLDKVIEKAAFDEHMLEYGFWLGDDNVDEPTFFVLPYPFLYKELDTSSLQPAEAYYDPAKSEFFLDLETAARSADPSGTIQAFFQTTFDILIQELDWQGCAYYFTPLDMPKQGIAD
ncbi:hypothetical protein HNQ44_001424 [Planomicrobium koreense]|uniref:Uncharacterized protein n=1 Tax=Planococcus koreensis TaxID=112331 RepID=A0A7W8CQX4_9BACL|nr:DUF5996 family protein [Planococcus koreensis]MBB5180000.1 hypothetical protein [Planococcus koreensis]